MNKINKKNILMKQFDRRVYLYSYLKKDFNAWENSTLT